MKTLTLFATLFVFPCLVLAQPVREVSNLGIQEDRSFWQLGMGVLDQSLPVGSKTLPRFNFAYDHVNESVVQLFEVKLALSSDNHVVDLGYAIGFGPRKGWIHFGFDFNLGYAHYYEARYIHGLHYSVGPIVNFGIPWWPRWRNFRFHVATGWAGIAASNGNFPGNRALGGSFFEACVALSIK
jgi:hypothetical protein